MGIALAMTWRINERDITRLKRLLPVINDLYCGISIVAPDTLPAYVDEISSLANVKLSLAGQADNRRYKTIRQALEFSQAAHIHYCDGDHILSRMERHFDDWKHGLMALDGVDCLVIERSAAVFDTYPSALRETERIINLVGSHLLGFAVDLGSGARIFSRRAVEFLVNHASPNAHAVTADLEWVILLQRAGFCVKTYSSEGAIYEVASDHDRQLLESAAQWSKRTEIARMIIQAGIDAASRDDLPDCTQSLYNTGITNNE